MLIYIILYVIIENSAPYDWIIVNSILYVLAEDNYWQHE